MPATNPRIPTQRRPLAYGFGATEIIYLIGLALLAAGVAWIWSAGMALLVCGAILLFTAFWNSNQRMRGL